MTNALLSMTYFLSFTHTNIYDIANLGYIGMRKNKMIMSSKKHFTTENHGLASSIIELANRVKGTIPNDANILCDDVKLDP